MYIPGVKFKEHYSIIPRDILDLLFYCFSKAIYDVIAFLICIIQKHSISLNEKKDNPLSSQRNVKLIICLLINLNYLVKNK